jgi:hypothetical protein
MADVARDEFKVVIKGSCCDLEVRVGQDIAVAFEVGADEAEDAGDGGIEGENGDSGKDLVFNVAQMALARSRAKSAFEEFSHCYGTGELGVTGNGLEPVHVGPKWVGAQEFGDGVGIEEERHGLSVQGRGVATPRARRVVQNPGEILRVGPPAGYAGKSTFGSSRAETLERLEFFGADDSGHGLTMPRDNHGLPVLGSPDVLTEFGLDLRYGSVGHDTPPHEMVKLTIMTRTGRVKGGCVAESLSRRYQMGFRLRALRALRRNRPMRGRAGKRTCRPLKGRSATRSDWGRFGTPERYGAPCEGGAFLQVRVLPRQLGGSAS